MFFIALYAYIGDGHSLLHFQVPGSESNWYFVVHLLDEKQHESQLHNDACGDCSAWHILCEQYFLQGLFDGRRYDIHMFL